MFHFDNPVRYCFHCYFWRWALPC